MSKHFRPWKIDEAQLLPASVQDYVPKDHPSRFIVALVREHLDLSEIEASYATTLGQPAFHPALMRDVLKGSDFRLKDLKFGVLSVFLCLPARHMDTHDRWLRVIINLAIGALEPRRGAGSTSSAREVPVLLLLEEFPVLKHMEKLEAAAGQLAGSGVRLWVIVQNLGQIKRHYKDGWETFIANAGVITAFANTDLETLGYIRGKLGNVPMLLTRPSGASTSALLSGARPMQDDMREAGLLETDELARAFDRVKQRMLVLAAGQQPLILQRVLYFSDPMFKGMFDQ